MLAHLQAHAQETVDKITEAVRPYAPVAADTPGHHGGAFRDSLTGSVMDGFAEGDIPLAITSDRDYAKFVVGFFNGGFVGTNPHVIEVRYARALRFWVDGTHLVFAQSVVHPGTEPNPFFDSASDAIKQIVQEAVRDAAHAMLFA
jgi:hypothetical protein